MITQRDLAMIGPRPRQGPRRPPLTGADSSGAGPTPVSVAVVLTVRGPGPTLVLADLRERVDALLGAGVREFVLDPAEVTGSRSRLVRAVGHLHRVIDEAGGRLTLADEP
jgi:hypothetical protein